METKNCLIQGYAGSFHELAMRSFFGKDQYQAIPCDSFDVLAKKLKEGEAPFAIMAIENSIAGSILQNYRILREYQFRILGEVYIKIEHQLLALPGQTTAEIKHVLSHPMALNQCLSYLDENPKMERIEFPDTALAAKKIAEEQLRGTAAIASKLAAEIYKLDILDTNIETVNRNFTRFFIIGLSDQNMSSEFDKASIYIRVKHEKGSLLQVLKEIDRCDINLSKLQSFPVLNSLHEYYFHLDLEFDDQMLYSKCVQRLKTICTACEILGEYKHGKSGIIKTPQLLNI